MATRLNSLALLLLSKVVLVEEVQEESKLHRTRKWPTMRQPIDMMHALHRIMRVESDTGQQHELLAVGEQLTTPPT